jgi:excisionase family DNA binding protein
MPSQTTAPTSAASLVEDGLATVGQAADFLGLSRATLYALMERGELPFCKIGKSRRVPRRALQEFAASNLVMR